MFCDKIDLGDDMKLGMPSLIEFNSIEENISFAKKIILILLN